MPRKKSSKAKNVAIGIGFILFVLFIFSLGALLAFSRADGKINTNEEYFWESLLIGCLMTLIFILVVSIIALISSKKK